MKYQTNPRYEKFVNEILDDVIMANPKVSHYEFFENNGLFKIFTLSGTVDFYAHTDKVCFGKNEWKPNGLNLLLEFIKIKGGKEICCPNCGTKINL